MAFSLPLLLNPFCSQAQPIACGQTITNTLTSAGQTVTYTFEANAGETLDILALGQGVNVAADVFAPTESQIASCTNNFTGPLTAAIAGNYSIRVHAADSVSTGAYGISLLFLTGRCGRPLIWGRPATNTLSALAEVDPYTFWGNAGETVVLTTSGSNLVAAAFLSGPDGIISDNWVNGVTAFTLTNTGTYTVGVYSFYLGGTGTYSLSLSLARLVPASYRLAIGRTNGAVSLTIWGQVGRPTTLRYVTQLPANDWLVLTNFSLPWSPYQFVDWASANAPRRFYRTVQ